MILLALNQLLHIELLGLANVVQLFSFPENLLVGTQFNIVGTFFPSFTSCVFFFLSQIASQNAQV